MKLALNSFITRQISHVSEEGWPALRKKMKRLALLSLDIPIIILASPIVIIIRLLRPFLIIRIGKDDIGRIGGTYSSNLYLSEKSHGRHGGRIFDWFYFVESINDVNQQWEKMWKRELPIFPWAKLAQSIEIVNQWFPGHKQYQIQNLDVMPTKEEHINYLEGRDPNVYYSYNKRLKCILGTKESNLSLTKAEEVRGEKELRQLGIPPEEPFICFHNRDSTYLDFVRNDINWQYHNYRDSSIYNYLDAVEEMTERGCYAIRLGSKVKEIIDSKNPKIINYASNGMRTDFLDIYLAAKCRFILCSDTGMSFPAEVFKRPLVYVNWTVPLKIPVYAATAQVIFKKFFSKNEDRFLTFTEVMDVDFGVYESNRIFDRRSIELIENTPEEIHAVTIEMDERLNGTWQTTEEDMELQERFWALFGPDKLKSPDLRIGAEYLRQNKDLLL